MSPSKFILLYLFINISTSQAHASSEMSPFKWLLTQASYSNPLQHLFRGTYAKRINDPCTKSMDCIDLEHSLCKDQKCQCQTGYFLTLEDATTNHPQFVCQKARELGEKCRNSSAGVNQCREPFICTDKDVCDCPEGFKPSNGSSKCAIDCQPNHILVKSKKDSKTELCVPFLDLGQECSHNEQCTTRYAQCLSGRCTCIQGTLRRQSQCVTVQQCPLGDAPLENGYPLVCDRKTLKCPENNYCLFAQFTDSRGFCCPTMKVNCPVGNPLSYGCSNCPWESHHCFTYSIGTHQQSMCCPNDCPRNLPIRNGDRCYAIAGYGNNCIIDEQCLSVLDSVCIGSLNETKTCQCPSGHILIDGICQKISKLGGECEHDKDCFPGSNTVCNNGYCKCADGFIPETVLEKALTVEHCIAEPSCPTVNGLVAIDNYEDCSTKNECSEGKYCRQWFMDPIKDRSYSICCPIPSVRDFEEICQKFGMKMLLSNGIDSSKQLTARPFRCQLQNFGSFGAEFNGDAVLTSAAKCPKDSACVFNPFTVNEGVCCHYEKKLYRKHETLVQTTVSKSPKFTTSAATVSPYASPEGVFRFPFSV